MENKPAVVSAGVQPLDVPTVEELAKTYRRATQTADANLARAAENAALKVAAAESALVETGVLPRFAHVGGVD